MNFFDNETIFNDTLLDEEAFDILNESNLYIFDRYPLKWIIPLSIAYVIIFIIGILGNISTCIVIVYNKPMHTPSNYYLFSLAISDILILIFALLPYLIGIWLPQTYIYGKTFCVFQMFISETAVFATVLTVTTFTIERYIAICHPILSHITVKLSRTVKFIIGIWIIAMFMSLPPPIELILLDMDDMDLNTNLCWPGPDYIHIIEITFFIFFVFPMILITVLYILIVRKLTEPKFLAAHGESESVLMAEKRTIKILVAVAIAFFLCWAPFHIRRLMTTYNWHSQIDHETFDAYIIAVLHISSITYFISAAINPVLYNIMSTKFRKAFKTTFTKLCNRRSNTDANKTEIMQIPAIVEGFSGSSANVAQNMEPSTQTATNISSSKDFTQHNIRY